MDENRGTFGPTLWTELDPNRDVKQLWFPGVHGDVGGGYARADLSDGALGWMIEEANKLGLAFRDGIRDRLHPDALGVLHDSLTGVFRRLRTCPRAVPRVAADRRCCTPRRASASPARASTMPTTGRAPRSARGAPVACDVYARQPWNVTGLFLEAGTPYRFTASGQWLDGSVPCGPGGAKDGTFHFGEFLQLAGTVIDQTEDLWRKLSDDERAEFWGSRRVNGYPWFSLVGVVANAEDGVHESFPIGAGTTYTRSAAAISTPTPTTPGPPTATTAAASA